MKRGETESWQFRVRVNTIVTLRISCMSSKSFVVKNLFNNTMHRFSSYDAARTYVISCCSYVDGEWSLFPKHFEPILRRILKKRYERNVAELQRQKDRREFNQKFGGPTVPVYTPVYGILDLKSDNSTNITGTAPPWTI
jgi:hypothetical protein